MAVCLVCVACLVAAEARGASSATVRSYNGQFVVTAPDVQYASEVAQTCEQLHQAVQRRLGMRRLWEGHASVWIAPRRIQTAEGPETVWDVSVERGGIARAERDLWFGQVDDFLRLAVCYHVVREVAEASAAAHNGTLRDRPIPFWLYAGLAELLEPEQRLDLFRNTAEAIDEKRSFLLADLFEHDDRFESVDQRAIFLQQAATVTDFLLGSKRGPTRLRQALENLWRRSSFTFSLRWEYRDLFRTLEAMEPAWEAYVRERPLHILSEERLTLAQTDALLEEVLKVDIPVIDAETIAESVVHTDLVGLSEHENRRVVQQICNEKAAMLMQISLRSAAEFNPVLDAYMRALNAIRDNKRRAFRRWYKRAQRAHEAVRKLPYFTKGEEE
jgi:hypothetical protein